MTRPRTVLLWGENELLTKAMEMFLTAGHMATWQVVRVPAGVCSKELVAQVQTIRPDLLILYQPKPVNGTDPLLKLLQEQPELKVIGEQPESRVIIVSLENNVLQVYTKQSITVQHVSDLLSVMDDRYSSEKSQ